MTAARKALSAGVSFETSLLKYAFDAVWMPYAPRP